ncbi:hypothetical protein E2C01_042391 [Portunus trituberculatus]|uniref:Uncharacterized protein n=1 Tax=Portunus trituberculatus TaxID=210409 RepID=A0A5B7FQ40_PORTR|nr:hypothetical protein [Portunus trituberculatus]
MASASSSSKNDNYHNYETDSDDILEDSHYDPGKEIEDSEIDSITSAETLPAREGEQSGDDSASGQPDPSASCFTLLSDPFADKQPDLLSFLKQGFTNVHPGIITHHETDPMATRGRGRESSLVLETPTTTTKPTPLSTSELTSTASTGAPAASRGAKTSHRFSAAAMVLLNIEEQI